MSLTQFQSPNFSHTILFTQFQSLLSLLLLLSLLSQLSQMSLLSLMCHRQVGRQVLITLQYSKGHFSQTSRTDRPTDQQIKGRTTSLLELFRAAKKCSTVLLLLLLLLIQLLCHSQHKCSAECKYVNGNVRHGKSTISKPPCRI